MYIYNLLIHIAICLFIFVVSIVVLLEQTLDYIAFHLKSKAEYDRILIKFEKSISFTRQSEIYITKR